MKKNIARGIFYYNRNTKKIYFGDIEEYDTDADEEDNSYSVSITKFFNIIGITENEFIDKVKQIDC